MAERVGIRSRAPTEEASPLVSPHAGDTSPAIPLFESHPLHGHCRESDTFSRLWNFMARWYNWRATAQTLRTDVSRAKYGGEGGIRTHGPRKGTAVFETARFGRSRTSPEVTPNRDH